MNCSNNFLTAALTFFTKKVESLFNNVLCQDGIICDDVGWWSGFNKVRDGVDNVDIGIGNIMEGTGSNNQSDPYHIASNVSFINSVTLYLNDLLIFNDGLIVYPIENSLIRYFASSIQIEFVSMCNKGRR